MGKYGGQGRRRQSFLQGALVLTGGMALVKVMGGAV